MNYRLTIDKDLINVSKESEAITILKRWSEEGKLELVEAEGVGKPNVTDDTKGWFALNDRPEAKGRHGHMNRRPKPAAGKINFAQVAQVLFPFRDAHRLSRMEINDVAHLIKHHGSGNELFITSNIRHFIEDGRREKLKSMFGILTMTPEEAVQMLGELESWK